MAFNPYLTYKNGLYYFDKGDYVRARQYFNILLNDSSYHQRAVNKLFTILMKESNTVAARDLLDREEKSKNLANYGLLELVDMNYRKALEIYNSSLSIPAEQKNALIMASNVYMNLGDFDIAYAMIEAMSYVEELYVTAKLKEIYLKMTLHDYDGALKLIHNVDVSKFNSEQVMTLFITEALILALKHNITGNLVNTYQVKRVTFDNDDDLVFHIRKHQKGFSNNESLKREAYFYEEVDLAALVREATKKINQGNPEYFNRTDIYFLDWDYPIGEFEGKPLNNIKVVTATGTKTIITMYPVLKSKQFDLENNYFNENLSLKRKKGVK